ncbi:MAG: hypothetical protein ACYC1C_12400 [Chloroflexota bacterium]
MTDVWHTSTVLSVGWLSGVCGAPAALLICALLSLTVTGAAWMRPESAEKPQAHLAPL